jgi:Protein of unknown function (DUF4236)
MPLRFYRRFSAGPFRINLSRSGVSSSIGRQGAQLTIGRNRVRTSIGIPGTGLGWYEQRRIAATRNPILHLGIGFVVLGIAAADCWRESNKASLTGQNSYPDFQLGR